SIITQPQDQTNVSPGATATFTVVAGGSTPLQYQWFYNTSTLLTGATEQVLTITNVQPANAGTYSVTVSNIAGTAISSNAVLTVTAAIPVVNSAYNLAGFAQGTTGGGLIAETNSAWRKITNAVDLAIALYDKKNAVKVIEIMNDLDLGYNELPPNALTN